MLTRGTTSVLFLLMVFNVWATNSDFNILLPDTFQVKNPDHYINYAAHLINEENLEEAKQIIDLGFEFNRKEKSDYLQANLNYFLADYYYYKQNYDSALILYSSVLPMFEEQADTLMIAKSLNSLGLLYSFKQDYEKELQFYLRENELLNQVKNKTQKLETEKIVLLTNILNLYSSASEYHKIIDNAPEAIELAIKLNDKLRLASIYNSLALAQKNIGDYQASLETFQKARIIFRDINDEFREAFIMNNIGGLYELDDNQLDSALFYYRSSLEGFIKEDYQWGITQSKAGVASILAKKKHYSESAKLYNEIIETAKEYEFNLVLSIAYEGLAQLEFDLKNYKEAYLLRVLHNELTDSLFNEEKHRQYAELQTKYEISQKENEINNLKTEKLSQELKLKKTQLHMQLGISVAIFLLVVVYIFVIFYNQKKKDNALLLEKNTQIEEQNQQLQNMNEHVKTINNKLRQSASELNDSNNAKNRFFSILAHDLRNPFHNIMGQSYLLANTFDRLTKEEQINYSNEIYNSCDQVNRLLENLLEWSRSQTKGIKFQPSNFKFSDVLKNTEALLSKNARSKNITIQANFENDFELFADKEMIETVLRNIINNSIKFTHNGGTIKVNAVLSNKKVKILVEDNGVGIEKQDQKKLFKIDSNFKSRGTNDEKGTGLGLVICKEFIDYHKGKIGVESEPKKGSTFYFEIPLQQSS